MPENWRLAASLAQLRNQIDALYPKRSKKSDGAVGDPSHRARASDHNPDANGIVRAIDVTHDGKADGTGMSAGWLAERLRLSRDPRIKYVIFDGRIFSSVMRPWAWRPYSGANKHEKHAHISVTTSGGDDPRPWKLNP